ncbi:PRTRC genetic system protein C [Paraburkholderia sp. JPY465]|uniref:PRTRC system protein C n=1 Tax=Paraburkholderia sp. JPY465 TaxID=3042285 RepID=UPI003D216803
MQTTALEREFRYNGAKLTDPSPAFSLQQVRDFYANTYPEIVNSEIEGPEIVGNKNVFTFRRAVGTKGSDPLHLLNPLNFTLKERVVAGRTYIVGIGSVEDADADQLDVCSKINAIMFEARNLPPAIRTYLEEIDRFASAHVCPLLDEEIAFVGALYARYAS